MTVGATFTLAPSRSWMPFALPTCPMKASARPGRGRQATTCDVAAIEVPPFHLTPSARGASLAIVALALFGDQVLRRYKLLNVGPVEQSHAAMLRTRPLLSRNMPMRRRLCQRGPCVAIYETRVGCLDRARPVLPPRCPD